MTTSRKVVRRGDGSAVICGWVAIYTFGLPGPLRDRRRGEVAGDLAEETLDAVRQGTTGDLRRRRLVRWLLGVPDDLSWRFIDAPAIARTIPRTGTGAAWAPLSRLSLGLLAIAAIGAGGALALTVGEIVRSGSIADTWSGWGPYGFVVACAVMLLAVVLAVPWPGRALGVGSLGFVLGMAAAPWLWGCWCLCLIALAVRRQQAIRAGTSS